jgi:succinyl-CoA synthetase beta subunit
MVINVTGGISTSAEIGEAVVNAIRAYNRAAGPANISIA